jgi:hypothetical protein
MSNINNNTLDILTNYTSEGETFYTIDGKLWRIGEKKISMWTKAKCNNIKYNTNTNINYCNDNQITDPLATHITDNSSH